MEEVDRSFRRSKYQYDHWDNAIIGYRETEKVNWNNSVCEAVINRLREATKNAVQDATMELIPSIHVLDLASDG